MCARARARVRACVCVCVCVCVWWRVLLWGEHPAAGPPDKFLERVTATALWAQRADGCDSADLCTPVTGAALEVSGFGQG